MTDELLPYYNRELTYIRRLAAEFAESHPKIAGRLRLSGDVIEDPHVSRLIEGFAYLNARIRQKLDDDFPELTDALLNVLYPHYLAPIPSMAIVQFQPLPDLAASHQVPARTCVETDPIDGEPCRFETRYPVDLWPLNVTDAAFTSHTRGAPVTPRSRDATGLLRITLRSTSKDLRFSQLGPERLRFFLNGQPQQVYPLYELLFNNVVQVAALGDDGNVTLLDADAIRPVGFEPDHGMLPYPPQTALGYRLLTEFFAFPEKFLFFEVDGLAQAAAGAGEQLELVFYLNRTSPELDHSVQAQTFALGCTPMVNLYRQPAEPIPLTHTETEYRVVPDARRENATEVYSVDKVTAVAPNGDKVEYRPFYGVGNGVHRDWEQTMWSAARRPSGPDDPGTDVYLALVDLGFSPSAPANWVVHPETTCLNRDLPGRLPYGGGQPHLQISEGTAPVSGLRCLTAPTRTLRPPLGRGSRWRLISHLSLNHLSLSNDDAGASTLREILHLYNFSDSADTRAMIDGVLNIRSRRVTGRVMSGGHSGLAGGIEIRVEFDEQRFTGSSLYLFASVLERFMALYSSINSFTRFVATVKGRDEVLRRWPARAGERLIL
ncbi:MAG: type VI secretion system baseplate subunit TssF [Gammaproteobacteria bacterium]